MIGWVKFHRRIKEWEWYTDGNTFRVFFHLILEANHADNVWRGIKIKRSQLITSYRKMALALDMTVQEVRTALNKLEPAEVTRKTTNKYTLITVVNYNTYQAREKENNKQSNKQITRTATNEQQAQQQTNNNKQEVKKLKKLRTKDLSDEKKEKFDPRKHYSDQFEKLYYSYPKRGGKRQGQINFRKHLKGHGYDNLKKALENYMEAMKIKGTQIKYYDKFSNFYGQKATFEDYLPDEYEKPKKPKDDQSKKNGFHNFEGGKDYTAKELNEQLGLS